MKQVLLKIQNLSCKIQNQIILDNVSFEVATQEKVALLGNNGSGKSTLFANIFNFVSLSKGTIDIFGKKNTNASFKKVGFLNEHNNLFNKLTVEENIRCYALLCDADYRFIQNEYYDLFDIKPINKKLGEQLSTGQARRVSLLLALIKSSELLLLDEPFTNIDPIYTRKIWEYLTQKQKDKTILYTTQNWEDIQNQASHIVALYEGKMLCDKLTTQDFSHLVPETHKILLPYKEDIVRDCLDNDSFYREEDKLIIFHSNPDEILKKIIPFSTNFSVFPKTIKDIYSYLVYHRTCKSTVL